MSNEELARRNAKRRIFQIGFVTDDLEKAMQAWIDNLGVGPWTVLTFTEATMKNFKVNGKLVTEPFKFLIAATSMGDLQIEILQPVYGPSHLSEFLAASGPGFHHIKERVADADIPGFLSGLRSRGVGILQSGELGADLHYHLDTESKLDFIYEIGNCLSVDLPPEIISTYPAET